jgi:hypothetical protein
MRHLPINASLWSNLLYRLRRMWVELNCKHTHTFTSCLENASWFASLDARGNHKQLRLVGCYLCGRIWVEDYGA